MNDALYAAAEFFALLLVSASPWLPYLIGAIGPITLLASVFYFVKHHNDLPIEIEQDE